MCCAYAITFHLIDRCAWAKLPHKGAMTSYTYIDMWHKGQHHVTIVPRRCNELARARTVRCSLRLAFPSLIRFCGAFRICNMSSSIFCDVIAFVWWCAPFPRSRRFRVARLKPCPRIIGASVGAADYRRLSLLWKLSPINFVPFPMMSFERALASPRNKCKPLDWKCALTAARDCQLAKGLNINLFAMYTQHTASTETTLAFGISSCCLWFHVSLFLLRFLLFLLLCSNGCIIYAKEALHWCFALDKWWCIVASGEWKVIGTLHTRIYDDWQDAK